MLANGIYEILYRAEVDDTWNSESLLIALRDGCVIGSDELGGLFHGRCEFDPTTNSQRVRINLEIPAGGTLITEREPRHAHETIQLSASFPNRPKCVKYQLVKIAGQTVRVKVRFKGAIPN
jgi:hypothetical protein